MKNKIKSIIFIIFQWNNILRMIWCKICNKKYIVHCGQTHSPHFKSFIKNLVQHSGVPYFTICTFPYFNNDYKHSIFDQSYSELFGNKLQINEFMRVIYNKAENPIRELSFVNLLLSVLRPDILWIHELQSGSYFFSKETLKKQKKIFLTIYGNDIKLFENLDLHAEKIKNLINISTAIHVETRSEEAYLINKDPRKKIFRSSATLKNFSEFKRFNNSIDKKSIDILIKGGTGYRSGSAQIYDIVRNNINFFINYTLVIIEADDYDNFLFIKLKENFKLKIEIYSRLEHYKVLELMKKSKFLLSNSYSDGISNLCTEAIFLGCMVITSEANGISEEYDQNIREKYIYKDIINFQILNECLTNYDDETNFQHCDMVAIRLKEFYSVEASQELALFANLCISD